MDDNDDACELKTRTDGLTDRGFYTYTHIVGDTHTHTHAPTHTHTHAAPIMLKEDEAEAVGPAEDEAAARGGSRKRQ